MGFGGGRGALSSDWLTCPCVTEGAERRDIDSSEEPCWIGPNALTQGMAGEQFGKGGLVGRKEEQTTEKGKYF